MKFTIFTGCYNSEPYIQRVFDSIKSQTYKDFEWIVIDDCSKDNTVSVLKKFIAGNPQYSIRLIENEKNQGVGTNRRHAIRIATGDFFVTWDHDDVAKPNQLGVLNSVWTELGNDKIANIFCMCEDQYGKLYGKPFPQRAATGNYLGYYKEYFMKGAAGQERHVCTRVEVLRQFIDTPFPEGNRSPDGGDILWAAIALKYDSIMLGEVLRVYYNDPHNVSNMSTFTRSQKAAAIYITKLIWVNHFLPRLKDFVLKIRYWFALVFYGFISGKKLKNILTDVTSGVSKIMVACLALPARLLISYMKIRGRGL